MVKPPPLGTFPIEKPKDGSRRVSAGLELDANPVEVASTREEISRLGDHVIEEQKTDAIDQADVTMVDREAGEEREGEEEGQGEEDDDQGTVDEDGGIIR